MSLSIDEIVLQVKKNDKEAQGLLFSWTEKKMPLIWEKFENLLPPLENDPDNIKNIILQETMKAVKYYDPDKANFYTFWFLCLKRAAISYARNSSNEKMIYYHRVTYLENDFDYCEEQESNDNYESALELKKFLEETSSSDDPYLKKIINMYLQGYTLKEISKICNIDYFKVVRIFNKAVDDYRDKYFHKEIK